MKKNTWPALIVLALLLALYNVAVFAAPFARGTVFWIVYVFTTLSFLLQIGIAAMTFGRAGTMRAKFLGFPVFYVGIIYMLLQLVSGLLFMSMPIAPVWLALIISAVILCAAVISVITVSFGRQEVGRIEQKISEKTLFIKSLRTKLELLEGQARNGLIKQGLRELADVVRYSDPMSSSGLHYIEAQIEEAVAELGEAIVIRDEDAARAYLEQLRQLVNERNKKCLMLK